MIQKRTMMRGSGQPFCSKWWWIGAIRNTRRPNSLKLTTWVMTLTASRKKMPPMRMLRSSFFVRTAIMPSPPPSDSEPTSPMNTCAG